MRVEAGHVMRGAVALVDREVVAGNLVVHRDHDPVACDLREDAGGSDACRRAVAADHRERRRGQARNRESVGEDVSRCHVELCHRSTHTLDIGDVDTDPVDLVGVDDDNRPARGIPRDSTIEGFARGLGEAFGIVEISQRRQLSRLEHACGDHQWACARTPTCFVDACDRTQTTAVQRELESAQPRGPPNR